MEYVIQTNVFGTYLHQKYIKVMGLLDLSSGKLQLPWFISWLFIHDRLSWNMSVGTHCTHSAESIGGENGDICIYN